MNKNAFLGKSVRLAFITMLAFLMPVLNSCQKETADTRDLLATVPSSSGIVAGINLKSILEKAGCKVDGADITPGKEVTAWIDSQKDVKDSNRRALKLILDGESGIDPSVAVFFMDAYNSYVTVSLADTKKFEEFVASQSDEQFEDVGDGVHTCGNIAVKGAQAWVCVSSNNTIDAKAVANYANLGDNQSFMKNEFSSKIATMTKDVVGWGDIKSFSKQGFSFNQLSSASMFMNAVFEDASALSFDLDFQKGKTVASVSVLNTKGENAKYLLPTSKVDLSTVESLGEHAELVIAMTITKDFTKKLEKIGGSMLSSVIETIKPIDGTVAVACGSLDNPEESFSGVVTTDGEPSREFMAMLSQFGATKKDGKLIRVSKGTLAGGFEVDKVSDYLKGSILGVVLNTQAPGLNIAPDMFNTLTVTLVPQGSGLKCDIVAVSNDQSKNMFLSFIEGDTKK